MRDKRLLRTGENGCAIAHLRWMVRNISLFACRHSPRIACTGIAEVKPAELEPSHTPAAAALEDRVLNSYRSIRTAAVSLSDRTTRPVATNCSGQVPCSLAGQFTAISTSRPGWSRSLVVNRIPPLLMSSVFPDPLTCTAFDCRTLYRTSSFTGNRLFPRRSTVPPKLLPPDLFCSAVMFLLIMMLKWTRSNNSPKALIAL